MTAICKNKKSVRHLNATRFSFIRDKGLFYLLKIRIRDGVVTAAVLRALVRVAALEAAAHVVRVETALRAALGTGVLVHLLAGLLPHGVHLVHGSVDAGDVFGFMGALQLGEGGLDL